MARVAHAVAPADRWIAVQKLVRTPAVAAWLWGVSPVVVADELWWIMVLFGGAVGTRCDALERALGRHALFLLAASMVLFRETHWAIECTGWTLWCHVASRELRINCFLLNGVARARARHSRVTCCA